MVQPGTLAFMRMHDGSYFVRTVESERGDAVVFREGGHLARTDIRRRGPLDDGLPGRSFSTTVIQNMSADVADALRALPSELPIGPVLVHRIIAPVLTAIREGTAVAAGIDLVGHGSRYVRIEPSTVELFDWNFVTSTIRHIRSAVCLESVRVFTPAEWKSIAATGLLRRRTRVPAVGRRPSAAAVKAFFMTLIADAAQRGEERPTYSACFKKCREELKASDSQMRIAWAAVSALHDIKRGRRGKKPAGNTDSICEPR